MRSLTIGLEIHVKLKSINKLFCQCKNEQNFDTLIPNTNICPVCIGQPGALPTLSAEAIEKGYILGKTLGCTINPKSTFDRKSYFYPDLPMGYQITQKYHPIATHGEMTFFLNNYTQEKKIHILEAHLECDTAKMIHHEGQAMIDFNRAGTPLMEIVTEPDFRTTDEVIEFLKELQRIIRYNDIGDADLEKGQMRVDVNISIRKNENDPYGTRAELKNINSFGAIKRAIEHEYARQITIYEAGETFTQETRSRNDTENTSKAMRSKEEALDYRYFPEPDLPPLVISQNQFPEKQWEIPYSIITTMKNEYGFHKEYINALIGDKELLDYFLHLATQHDPKLLAKWLCGPIAAWIKENFKGISELPFTSIQFNQFLTLAQENKILENQLKIVMEEMLATGNDPEAIITEKGFDTPAVENNDLEIFIQTILKENPTIVEQYKSGKTTTLGFFTGQVMKKTQGKANPQIITELLKKALN